MKLNEAVAKRIENLCRERNITIYKLAKDGGMNKNTIYQVKDCSTVTLNTIYEICATLNISLKEFFDDEIFSSVDD